MASTPDHKKSKLESKNSTKNENFSYKSKFSQDVEFLQHKSVNIPNLALPPSLFYLRGLIHLIPLPNGLTWLSIQDPLQSSSTGAFRVEAGSYDESRVGVENGVAHLLEHSFFLKNTPSQRNLFSNWNANTGSQATNFMFTTTTDRFVSGLGVYWDDISNFTATEKIKDELENVNSE